MKQKTHRLLSLLLCCVLMLGLIPTTALAEDTRIAVDTVKASATMDEPSYGAPTDYPVFTVTEGSPAFIPSTMIRWEKKNTVTGKWDTVFSGNTFTEGKWRISVQVRIDNENGDYGKTHKLSENPKLFVNGVEWTISGKPSFYEYQFVSFAFFKSQEFEVTAPPLVFTDSESYDIKHNYVGTEINSYYVAEGAKYGTKPYTFSKVSGPDWITVSPDGKISGTPTTVGPNDELVVRVTDSSSVPESAEISIYVAPTEVDTRIEIDTVKATATMDEPSYGAPTKNPKFTVTEGSPAYIPRMMINWQKKNTETGKWEYDYSDTFTEGTWRLVVQVRIDNENGDYGKTHKLSENPKLFVNDAEWTIDGKTFIEYDYSCVLFRSPEYAVTSSTLPQIYNITVTHGVARDKNDKEITKAKPGDKVVLQADNRLDEGWKFEKWVVNGVTVDNEKEMNTQFIMPESDVTAKATYIPCDISITAVDLTLNNYVLGKKAGDISAGITTPNVDLYDGDAYYQYDDEGRWESGSYGIFHSDESDQLGAEDPLEAGKPYKIMIDVKPEAGYTLVGLSKENAKLNGIKAYSIYFYRGGATLCFDLAPLEASHIHTYGTEWKSDADNHWHECTDADCPNKTDSVKDKALHTPSGWIVDTEATSTTDGTKHKECTVCHRVLETGKIPATGSDFSGSDFSGGVIVTDYTLTFDTNGGSSISTIIKAKETTVDLEKYEPTKEGYEFTGWYSDKELTNEITSIKLTKNTTVYAGWKAVKDNPKTAAFPFVDVDTDDWFFEDVAYVYDKGLMNGTSATIFAPHITTTRGMIVTILYRLENEPAVSGSLPFDDVKPGSYNENAIMWAAENNIVTGYGNGKFGPEDHITREQMAAILWRYAKYKGYDVSIGEDTNILSYGDALSVSKYAISAIQWAFGDGIMNGTSAANISPQGNATRAQVAAILHRFFEKLGK
ncbi:MAG: S-layer homology domain-containing protein [Ezakiella sp.]|nr:S-layer homology domain-containing protein [Ezakiella sp.]